MLGKEEAEHPECQDAAEKRRYAGTGKPQFGTSEVTVYQQVVPDNVDYVGP